MHATSNGTHRYFGLQYLCTVAAMSSPTREAGQLMAVVQPSLFAMLSCIRLGLVLVEHSTESNAALQAAIHFPQRQLEVRVSQRATCPFPPAEYRCRLPQSSHCVAAIISLCSGCPTSWFTAFLQAVQDEMRGCAEDVSRSLMAVERLEGELRGLKNHLQVRADPAVVTGTTCPGNLRQPPWPGIAHHAPYKLCPTASSHPRPHSACIVAQRGPESVVTHDYLVHCDAQRSIGVVSHVHTNELEVEDRVIELSRRLDDLQRHVSQATTPPPPITLWSLLRFESPLRKARNLLLALLKEDFADREDVRRMVRRVAPQVSS